MIKSLDILLRKNDRVAGWRCPLFYIRMGDADE